MNNFLCLLIFYKLLHSIVLQNITITLTNSNQNTSNFTVIDANLTDPNATATISYINVTRTMCASIITTSNATFVPLNSSDNLIVVSNSSSMNSTNSSSITKLRQLQSSNYTLFNYTLYFGPITQKFTNCYNLTFLTDSTLQFSNNQGNCPAVSCTGSVSSYQGACMNYNNFTQTIQINSCPINHYCPLKSINQTINLKVNSSMNTSSLFCKAFPMNVYSGNDNGLLVDYDYCDINSDCASGNCTNNVCYGRLVNSYCTNNYQCNAESYCDNRLLLCLPRKTANESCKTDGECKNEYGCLNGKCTEYFSLHEGTDLSSKYSYNSVFCASNYAVDNICRDLINTKTYPYFCNVSSGCSYYISNNVNKTVNFLSACNCDLSGNGNAYCQHDTNSSEFIDYISNLKKILKYKCHFFNKGTCSLIPYSSVSSMNFAAAQFSQINRTNSDYSCIDPVEVSQNPVLFCKENPCNNGFFNGLFKGILLIVIIIVLI